MSQSPAYPLIKDELGGLCTKLVTILPCRSTIHESVVARFIGLLIGNVHGQSESLTALIACLKKGYGGDIKKGTRMSTRRHPVDLNHRNNYSEVSYQTWGKEGTLHMWEGLFCASDAASEMVQIRGPWHTRDRSANGHCEWADRQPSSQLTQRWRPNNPRVCWQAHEEILTFISTKGKNKTPWPTATMTSLLLSTSIYGCGQKWKWKVRGYGVDPFLQKTCWLLKLISICWLLLQTFTAKEESWYFTTTRYVLYATQGKVEPLLWE